MMLNLRVLNSRLFLATVFIFGVLNLEAAQPAAPAPAPENLPEQLNCFKLVAGLRSAPSLQALCLRAFAPQLANLSKMEGIATWLTKRFKDKPEKKLLSRLLVNSCFKPRIIQRLFFSEATFSPDGKSLLITDGRTSKTTLYDLNSRTILCQFQPYSGKTASYHRAKFSPKGNYIFFQKSLFTKLPIYRVANRESLQTLSNIKEEMVEAFYFSPNDEFLLFKKRGLPLEIISLTTEEIVTQVGPANLINSFSVVQIDPSSRLFAINSPNAVTFYEIPSGTQRRRLNSNGGCFNGDGTRFASIRTNNPDDSHTEIYDTSNFTCLKRIPSAQHSLSWGKFNRTNTRLLTIDTFDPGLQVIWDLATSTIIKMYPYEQTADSQIKTFDKVSKLLYREKNESTDTFQVSIESCDTNKILTASFRQNFCQTKFCPATNQLFLGANADISVLVNLDDGSIQDTFEDCWSNKRKSGDIKFSTDGQFLMLKAKSPAQRMHIWRLLPFSLETPLPEMMAYLVLQNNLRNKQQLCPTSQEILKQSRQCALQEFAEELSDQVSATSMVDLARPSSSPEQLLISRENCIVQ